MKSHLFFIIFLKTALIFSQTIQSISPEIYYLYDKNEDVNHRLYNRILLKLKNDTDESLLFVIPNQVHFDTLTVNSLKFWNNYNLATHLFSLQSRLILYENNVEILSNPCFSHIDQLFIDSLNLKETNFLSLKLDENTKEKYFEKYIKNTIYIVGANEQVMIELFFSFPNNFYKFIDYEECFSIEQNKNYFIKIELVQNKEIIKDLLPKKMINMLDTAQIKIFDGVLLSNYISISSLIKNN